jgi:hypothetical protein
LKTGTVTKRKAIAAIPTPSTFVIFVNITIIRLVCL